MIKFQANRSNLVHTLQKVQKIIGSTKAESETTGVVFLLGDGRVEVLGLSESRYIKTNLAAENVSVNGSVSKKITTDFRKLSDVLSGMRDDVVSLNIEDTKLLVLGKKSKFTLPIASKDLPEEELDKKNPSAIDPKELAYVLKNTQFSSSTESSRPILSSVKVVPQGAQGSLFVTTDGFRLSLVRSAITFGENQKIQIPINFFRDVVSLILDPSKKTTISFTDDDKCVFEQDGILIWTKMVVGDFPPYEKVLFPEYQTTISCEKDSLLEAVKAISVMSRDFSNIIVVDLKKDKISVRTKKEVGGENEVEVGVLSVLGLDEKEITIAFNAKYLSDFLSTVTDDSITLKINRADSPALFLPGQADPETNVDSYGFRHVIMPVRISE